MPIYNDVRKQTAIVVGGGIVGLCCALNLQQRGFETTLVSALSEKGEASWGNAGHIAVEQVEPLASPATLRSFPARLFWRGGALSLPLREISAWFPFALRLARAAHPHRFRGGRAALKSALALAMPAWQRLAEGLQAPDLLLEDGHFIVWESGRTAAAGRASWTAAETGTASFRDATDEELAMLAAAVKRPLAGAIRFAGSGQIADLGKLASKLYATFRDAGGSILEGMVTRIIPAEHGSFVRLVDGALRADIIVVAAGTGSKNLLEPLGHNVPIIAERGYHIQAAPPPEWPDHLPPVVFEDRSMIVTRFRSSLRAASFVEFIRPTTAPDCRIAGSGSG